MCDCVEWNRLLMVVDAVIVRNGYDDSDRGAKYYSFRGAKRADIMAVFWDAVVES